MQTSRPASVYPLGSEESKILTILRRSVRARICLAGLLAWTATGCGDPRLNPVPVSGKVLHQGRPAHRALIIFHPAGGSPDARPAHGRVAADGTFRLSTEEANDGAIPGKYGVTIIWPAAPKTPGDDPDSGPDQLKGRYADPRSPKWTVTVGDQGNEFPPFEVK